MNLAIDPAALTETARVIANPEGWGCPGDNRCRNKPAFVAVRSPQTGDWWLTTPCAQHVPAESSGYTYLLVPLH